MVGLVERDEALGMLGGGEDAPWHCSMPTVWSRRRVHHEQRLAQARDAILDACPSHPRRTLLRIVNVRPASVTLATPSRSISSSFRVEMVEHMGDVGRGCDRHHRRGLGDTAGSREHRGAAERVADEQRRRRELARADDRRRARGPRRSRRTRCCRTRLRDDPSPVKSNRSTAIPSAASFAAMCAGGDDVLRAREAVREQRIGAHGARRKIEARGKLVAETAGEGDADCAGCHEHLPGRRSGHKRSRTRADGGSKCQIVRGCGQEGGGGGVL